jgi:hypothetical protein
MSVDGLAVPLRPVVRANRSSPLVGVNVLVRANESEANFVSFVHPVGKRVTRVSVPIQRERRLRGDQLGVDRDLAGPRPGRRKTVWFRLNFKQKMSFRCHQNRKIAANQPISGDRNDVSGVILSGYPYSFGRYLAHGLC